MVGNDKHLRLEKGEKVMIYNSTIKSVEFLLSDLKFYQKEGKAENGEKVTAKQTEKLVKDIEQIIEDLKV